MIFECQLNNHVCVGLFVLYRVVRQSPARGACACRWPLSGGDGGWTSSLSSRLVASVCVHAWPMYVHGSRHFGRVASSSTSKAETRKRRARPSTSHGANPTRLPTLHYEHSDTLSASSDHRTHSREAGGQGTQPAFRRLYEILARPSTAPARQRPHQSSRATPMLYACYVRAERADSSGVLMHGHRVDTLLIYCLFYLIMPIYPGAGIISRQQRLNVLHQI